MDNLRKRIIESSRKYRDKVFEKLANIFLKLKISANIMTLLSLILGIFAIFFLFKNYYLYLLFTFAHLLADGLDGVIARKSVVTKLGIYLDHFTDRFVELSILIAIGIWLKDYYVFILIGIYVLTQIIYVWSKFSYPIVFSRTTLMIILAFYPLKFLNIAVIAYLTAGVIYSYSLALQFSFFLKSRESR